MSKKRISVPKPDRQERRSFREALGLLGSGRAGLENAALQHNLLAPSLYDIAGFDVEYEDRSGRLAQLQAERDKAISSLTDYKSARAGGPASRRAFVDQLQAGDPALAALANAKGKIKGKKLKGYLRKTAEAKEREIGEESAAPLRIKSIKEKASSQEQRAREEAILKQEQEMLQKSLSMDSADVLAADPALARQIAEEQAQLEQAQVGQFGSLAGASGGTVGAVQNAAMAQRRAEAISNARRENIGLYAGLQTQQAQQNQNLAAGKQALGAMPGSLAAQSGMNFGNLASGYGGLLSAKAGQRQMQFQANSFNQTQPSIGESILKGIGGLLQPFKDSGA